MSSPRIAVLQNRATHLGQHYRDWLAAAGLTELELFGYELRSDEARLKLVDCAGLVITGGGDFSLHSGAYSDFDEALKAPLYHTHEGRDRLEKLLLDWAMENGRPFLGVCRGLQSLNVQCGGTLIPDIQKRLGAQTDPAHTTTAEELADPDTPDRFHALTLPEGSLLKKYAESSIPTTNSYHHQAVDQLGKGLVVDAHAPDGIVEAVHLEGRPEILAVQFHPERMPEVAWMGDWTKAWASLMK